MTVLLDYVQLITSLLSNLLYTTSSNVDAGILWMGEK